MKIRLLGLGGFLVLVVGLWLLLARPPDEAWSSAAGAALVATFPLLTRPIVLRDLERRCVWSGQEIAPGCTYRVRGLGGSVTFHAYNEPFRDRAARFFTSIHRQRYVLVPLLLLAPAAVCVHEALRAAGVPTPLGGDQAGDLLRAALAAGTLLAVLGFFLVRPIPHHAKEDPIVPIPVSCYALLGVRFTLLVALVASVVWIRDLIGR